MRTTQSSKRAIIERAFQEATRIGLESVTIGNLASDLGLSKAGVHSHFGTKEALQADVVAYAIDEFTRLVIQPALAAEAGLPRLKALFGNWVGWYARHENLHGCFFVSNATEMDDRPGVVREALLAALQTMLRFIADLARECVREGQFAADSEPQQFAFEMYGIILAHHNADRFLKDAKATARARKSFEALLLRYATPVRARR
jgi:AcrR family transcriptional regulator